MEIPLFLAMTAGELAGVDVLPEQIAWMACHFSSYGTGLSNLPEQLPHGSMLILNDRTPICGHDPVLVSRQLCERAQRLKCSHILLDLQREDTSPDIVQAILSNAPGPVGLSTRYAYAFPGPVLLPPIPTHILLSDAVAPWQDREIWLELSREGTEITVTAEGSRYTPLPFYIPPDSAHEDRTLHCHYEITVSEKEIRFLLGRTEADQRALLAEAMDFGVTCSVGLWQEIKRDPHSPVCSE